MKITIHSDTAPSHDDEFDVFNKIREALTPLGYQITKIEAHDESGRIIGMQIPRRKS